MIYMIINYRIFQRINNYILSNNIIKNCTGASRKAERGKSRTRERCAAEERPSREKRAVGVHDLPFFLRTG